LKLGSRRKIHEDENDMQISKLDGKSYSLFCYDHDHEEYFGFIPFFGM
jgi:hypothetical protein